MKIQSKTMLLIAAGLFTSHMAVAQITAQELNAKGAAKPPAEELAPNAMIKDKSWEAKQWDKAQWDKMSDKEKMDYRNEHTKRWGSMNKTEQDSYRKSNMGRTNYAHPEWNNDTKNINSSSPGTPK